MRNILSAVRKPLLLFKQSRICGGGGVFLATLARGSKTSVKHILSIQCCKGKQNVCNTDRTKKVPLDLPRQVQEVLFIFENIVEAIRYIRSFLGCDLMSFFHLFRLVAHLISVTCSKDCLLYLCMEKRRQKVKASARQKPCDADWVKRAIRKV